MITAMDPSIITEGYSFFFELEYILCLIGSNYHLQNVNWLMILVLIAVHILNRYFDYLFYVDFDASMADQSAQNALRHLKVCDLI